MSKTVLERKEIGKYIVNRCIDFIEVVLKEDKSKKKQIYGNIKLKKAFEEENPELIDEVFEDLRKRPPSRKEIRRLQKMIKGMNRNKPKNFEKISEETFPSLKESEKDILEKDLK